MHINTEFHRNYFLTNNKKLRLLILENQKMKVLELGGDQASAQSNKCLVK